MHSKYLPPESYIKLQLNAGQRKRDNAPRQWFEGARYGNRVTSLINADFRAVSGLFLSQCSDRVDPARAPRRKIGRKKPCGRGHDHDGREGQRVESPHSEEEALE